MGIKGQGHIIKKVSTIHGCSLIYVRQILNGERKNAAISNSLKKMRAGETKLHEAIVKRVNSKK